MHVPFLIRHVPFFSALPELAGCPAQDVHLAGELAACAANCQVQPDAYPFTKGQPGVHGAGNQGRDVAAGVQGFGSSQCSAGFAAIQPRSTQLRSRRRARCISTQ